MKTDDPRPIHSLIEVAVNRFRVFADIGAMRDEGEGVARIFDEMADRQLPGPDITCEGGLFNISLFGEGDPSE